MFAHFDRSYASCCAVRLVRPETRARILDLLQRQNLTQAQKVDMIAQLIRESNGTPPTGAPGTAATAVAPLGASGSTGVAPDDVSDETAAAATTGSGTGAGAGAVAGTSSA